MVAPGLALLTVFLLATEAAARRRCNFGNDPPPEGGPLFYLAPIHGAVEVPLNTLIWGATLPGLQLVGEGGVIVPLVEEAELMLEKDTLFVHRPAQNLLPDTLYQTWTCHLERCDQLQAEFRTGTGVAVPPEVPVLVEQSILPETRQYRVYLDFEFSGVLVAGRESTPFDGLMSKDQVIFVYAEPERIRLEAGCNSESSEVFKFGTFNLAGEFSGWSEPEVIVFHDGCRVADSSMAWVVLLLIVRRRGRGRGP